MTFSHTRVLGWRDLCHSLCLSSLLGESQDLESVGAPHIDGHSLLAWWCLAKETAFLIPLLWQKRSTVKCGV